MTASPLHDAGWLGNLAQTEDRCRRYLAELRWPDGVCCPQCGARPPTEIPARRRFYCRRCRHFFSVTSGTVFHRSHLPIWKWFVAIELLLDSDEGLTANHLWSLLGGSYKTAWFAEHRIRAALCTAQGAARVGGRTPGGYRPAYEAEHRWRTRQRENGDAFRETVLALLRAEPLPLEQLVHSP
jgi:transposase-like protein